MAKRDSLPYSIAKMSDGERAALVICAEIISAPSNTVFIIDEPELHLHRSIVVPLLRALLDERVDCAFVVSTHELDLPANIDNARAILVRSSTWAGDHIRSWDVDILELASDLPEDLLADVLGSRRKILFIEGESTSLDQPLYGLLFPNVTLRPKGTARDVIYAVQSLRSIEGVHRAKAYGLIDDDDLTPERKTQLMNDGVYPLPVATVESLYYSDPALFAVSQRQASTFGQNSSDLIQAAKAAAIAALESDGVLTNLAARRADLKLRNLVLSQMPDRQSINQLPENQFAISLQSPLPAELTRLRALVAAGSVGEIFANYPVRYSGALDAVARALHFRNRHDYERALLSLVGSDERLRGNLRALLSPLDVELV